MPCPIPNNPGAPILRWTRGFAIKLGKTEFFRVVWKTPRKRCCIPVLLRDDVRVPQLVRPQLAADAVFFRPGVRLVAEPPFATYT